MAVFVRLVLGALLAAVTLLGAPAAPAHTVLTASDPQADATLTTGPARVSATFNETLQPSFAAMTVVGPDGNLWSAGEPVVDGAVVSVGLRALGPAGKYTVNYRVTSADGHVVTGAWSFSVTESTSAEPGPSASTETGAGPIPLWAFAVGALLLVAGAAVWALRRRS